MTKRLKVVEFCSSESLGGLELYFATCCMKLKHRQHHVTAVVKRDTKLYHLLKEELDLIILSGNTIKAFFQLRKLLAQNPCSTLHIHHKKDLLLAAFLKRFSGIKFKCVHTRHMDQPRNKRNPYHTFLYRSMDIIITVSNRLKDQIISKINVDPEKVVCLYHGVSLVIPKPERAKEIDLKKDHFNIGVIARIDQKKNQKVIIESTKMFNDKKISVYLIGGVTDTAYHSEVRQMIKNLKLENQIQLTGFIKNPQELMTCFDTVVLTTGNETFGLVLPEAMRMGVPVIGAKGGGVPEIIDHDINGFMFEPDDATDLKNQIEKMMDENTRSRIGKEGKKKADKLFEIENHFDELEILLSQDY